jgi:plastocyanin
MITRDIYLRIERIPGYSPVMPADHTTPPVQYGRDCMRNMGHEDGSIPPDEIEARRLTALIYREYLDPQYLVPKPDKLVAADINEPAYPHRVPGTVIYASPGERLRIHVKNADSAAHSFHVHGLRYGIDSDGAWPLGTQSADGRRSDEICPGQTWTYTYDVDDEMLGAWPFHDHCRNIGANTNQGLFGGIVVLPEDDCDELPRFAAATGFLERAVKIASEVRPRTGGPATTVATAPTMGGMPVMGGMTMDEPVSTVATAHHQDLSAVPDELVPFLATLDELAHAPQPLPDPDALLHVPLFFHQMSGARSTPVFASPPLNAPGGTFPFTFTLPGTYNYICGIHGAIMSGSVTVIAGGPSSNQVHVKDFAFTPATVPIGVGGTVTWINEGPSQHSVVEAGGDSLPSYCFNGRSFVGNTPTIVAHSGQRIRWYVFDLDLGMGWHNFHPHSQRWTFADQPVDVRSLGPAESFVLDTVVPPVLLLPEDIAKGQRPGRHPKGAKEYHLRGDFLFHCHVEMHMMGGLAGLVRAQQTVWLTDAQKHALETTVGLPLDPGDNACPEVVPDRCANASGGRWQELPGAPGVTFMHAVLLPNSKRVFFWGYGQRHDQARIWDQETGAYMPPANQPMDIFTDANLWSGAHAHLNDAGGTVLAHGGFAVEPAPGGGVDASTEKRSLLFDPGTDQLTATGDMHASRFYPTTITLADGKPMTLFGVDTLAGPASNSLEIFDPVTGTWSAPTMFPTTFTYVYYPWTFMLPGGEVFIAGPQEPARRFNHMATPIVDDAARQYPQVYPQRGANMNGTAVLLPLRPPGFSARVLLAGGNSPSTGAKAEWIDLSATAPVWTALPDLNIARDAVNSVLLPDGRVAIMGGFNTPPDGGPVELFDPEDPQSGFQLGPGMKHPRGYHSAAILMPDGSVVMGGDWAGDRSGGSTPNERYLPSYFFRPRPTITAPPSQLNYGTAFSVSTPTPTAIAEVVLMRAGAVTHGFNHNQRYVGCAITGASATAVKATAPPDGTVAPPGHYLLFLLDHERVPSEGKWVRLS